VSAHYTPAAKGLHWLMAVLLSGLLALGFYMHDLPLSPEKLKLYSWHKWAGVTAFLLVALRLAWRVTHRPPAFPDSMARLMRAAAHAGHLALYLLMIAIPLSGWLMSSAKGVQTVYFGVLPLPDLVGRNKELGEILAGVHKVLNLLFIALIGGHIAAALKHHIRDKDGTLKRMSPFHRPEQ
jgi:cytochrome b561